MSDVIQAITGESPEAVAYHLLRGIAAAEGKKISGHLIFADRQWMLDAYRECLDAVRGKGGKSGASPERAAAIAGKLAR